nr:TOBE domain-containing protein [Poseidonocella pacifica]
MNRIPAKASAHGIETPFGQLPLAAPGAGPLTLCLRPEAIGTGAGALFIGPATVRDAAFFGTHCRAHLSPEAAPDLTLIAHLPAASCPAEGETITLAADPAAASVFEAA